MSRSDLIVGIDIGSSKITTIVGQNFPEEERINVIGVANYPANGIRKGQIVNIEEATASLIQSVEAAERMAGYSINGAFISLSAPHIKSTNSQGVVAVASPKEEIIPEDIERVIEAARAISLPSSREILHVIPRQFTVDGEGGVIDPIGMSGVRLEVESHIVTASSPALKNLTKCIDEAGIKILSFVYSGFAAGESVLTSTEKELGVVLVDIGGGVSSITIYSEGRPCYSSVIPVGAKNVTNDLAIGLRLPLDKAEKLKLALDAYKGDEDKDEVSLKSLGLDEEEKKISLKTAVDGIIGPRLNETFSLIREEIKESGFGGTTPAGLVLVGGGAKTVGVKYHCQKTLGLPVRIGIPEKVGGIVDDLLSPEYASSLGLIFYGIRQKEEGKLPGQKIFGFGKIGRKLPIKGAFHRISEILRSLLP